MATMILQYTFREFSSRVVVLFEVLSGSAHLRNVFEGSVPYSSVFTCLLYTSDAADE